ncbi:protein serine/threonine phosphatase 2C [Atractiella rhizophila]|nr:protein serine/threonine phosphatase 2C [Atractiella rhizophila]
MALSPPPPRLSLHLALLRTRISPSPRAPFHAHSRRHGTTLTVRTPRGRMKVDLMNPAIFGVQQTRGERAYQEDRWAVHALRLPSRTSPSSPSTSPSTSTSTETESAENEEEGEEEAFYGIYDGHGSSLVSSYLHENLHNLILSSTPAHAQEVQQAYTALGGYMKRWSISLAGEGSGGKGLTLEDRMRLAFLRADAHFIANPPDPPAGSVGTVVLLTPPSYSPSVSTKEGEPKRRITFAHLGDTTLLLCRTRLGLASRLTSKHHPLSRSEQSRLQKVGTFNVDSFGEARWVGGVENTRAVGDVGLKKAGVIGDPDTGTLSFNDSEYSFLALTTDGLSSLLTDQEIVDLIRFSPTPKDGAKRVVEFAEQAGGRDNASCLVIALGGWGRGGGEDGTKSRREYRLKMAEGSGRQRRM